MKKYFLSSILFLFVSFSVAQLQVIENPYQDDFDEAYGLYPSVPRGMLEAVSYTQTRFQQLDETIPESCTGMPRSYGVMGLVEDGKNYFRENLHIVATFSGVLPERIQSDVHTEILAYAKSVDFVLRFRHWEDSSNVKKIQALYDLTEIPLQLGLPGNEYAYHSFLYAVIGFMNDPAMQAAYHFPNPKIDPVAFFGSMNYSVLQSGRITISEREVRDENENLFIPKSADYAPALWNPAASCNYSSRNGTAITAVTIHTVQGSYSGCISWFQNCSAGVSAHYVLRSSDGQITQMVLESQKAWHVGSENPYTIGLEHEGYVTNPAWYTQAMYTSSAALVSDICNSGYGINPIRTAWWPWASATQYNQAGIPGSCTKIKGHQHYPNQTHTDPGPNWDWNGYYKLLNAPPAATIYTAVSGTFYDPGGAAGMYGDDQRAIWTISPAGATSVTLTFNNFTLENTWDYIYVYDGNDINDPLIGYFTGTINPGMFTSSGSSLTVEFRSDCATGAPGWSASWNSSVAPSLSDSVAPVTSLATPLSWQTQNFNTQFTESDNPGGSGLEKAYYQVIDFDGTDWYANANRGFFQDYFNQSWIHPQWTTATGTWGINAGVLEQTDEALSNTNMYASLKQDLSNRYLFQFSGKIEGTGNNRRAGFHFFCDSAQLTNRGNSYFVWFRVDQSVVEFYKVVNDVFSLMHSEPLIVNANQWYDYKIFYDRITGKITVYRDNIHAGSWTDPSPYSTGKYISFRSGNCSFQVNNFRVFRSRNINANTMITLGNCAGCDIRYQNTTPSSPAGQVKSLVVDSVGNISSVSGLDIHADWTAPDTIVFTGDGDTLDIDTTYTGNQVAGNWSSSSDMHSDIARYWYAVGTAAGDSNIINWTDNWILLSFLDSINLTLGTTYYVSVRAENGAGLLSPNTTSDGQIYLWNTVSLVNKEDIHLNVFPNPFTDQINISFELPEDSKVSIELINMQGQIIATRTPGNMKKGYSVINWKIYSSLHEASYILKLSMGIKSYYIPVIKK